MRAVVIQDEQLTVQERPTPTAGQGDIVVAVHSAGLNAADLMQRRGWYPAPAGSPADIPGLELAGEVREIGAGVSGFMIGQRVCAVVGGGAQATHCVVDASHLIPIPPGAEMTASGGFAEAFTTAYDALVRQAHVQVGDRVLISGAAGGVGTAAVQIAHAWGALPIAVTRDNSHHEKLKKLGAFQTLTMEQVAAESSIDVVLELVGAAHLQLALPNLNEHARVVVIGVGGGSNMELNLLHVMQRRFVLTGSTLRSRSREEKALLAAEITRDLGPLWGSAQIRVPVAASFHIDEVSHAYDAFAQSGKFGKILLTTH